MQFYEDIEDGATTELGTHTVTREGIVSFAERYDPLSFHTDGDAAREAGFDDVIASGYQTICLANRMAVEGFRKDTAAVAGLGIENLRWPAPVRPGDTLTFEHEVAGKRVSESNPDVGIVRERITATNGAGETVISFVGAGLMERRAGEGD